MKLLSKILFWRNKPTHSPIQLPTLLTAVDRCHKHYEDLNDTLFLISQLEIEHDIYRKQIADFATKAEFGVGSLLATLKLALEEQEHRRLLIKMNERIKNEQK